MPGEHTCNFKTRLILLSGSSIIIIVVFLMTKYLFPYFSPFIIAYLIARIIEKPVNKLARKIGGKKMIASAFIMILFVGVLLAVIGYICWKGISEIRSFMSNFDDMFVVAKTQTANLCLNVDSVFGLHDGDSFAFLCKCTDSLKNVFSEEKASETVGKVVRISVPVIVQFTVVTGAVIVCFISVVYLSDVMDKIRDWQKRSIFREEVAAVGAELKKLINVYFKIQFIIMIINAGIVTAGLMIIRNPYALVLGILIGIVDALPIFGTGTVLLPWALISLLFGKFMATSVLLIVYVITYFVREIMESKCMGDRLGIAPFTMLVVVFVGIFVYGLLGFILGPVSYCIIKSLIIYFRSVLENGMGTW